MTLCLIQEGEVPLVIGEQSQPCGQCRYLRYRSDIDVSCVIASFTVLLLLPHASTELFPSLMILYLGGNDGHSLFIYV